MASHKLTKEEMGIVSKHTPNFSWFTFLTGIGFISLFITSTIFSVSGLIPLWFGFCLNMLSFTAMFVTIHDCMHRQITGKNTKLNWIDKTIGTIAGLLVQMEFNGWCKQHGAHHKATNIPGEDPNWRYHKNVFAMWRQTAIGYVILHVYAIPVIGKKICSKLITPWKYEYFKKFMPIEWTYQLLANWSIFFIAVFYGYGKYALVLWMLPSFVSRVRMHYQFIWSPHKNLTETGDYLDTVLHIRPYGIDRIWWRALLDYHLIHHLYPQVPSNKLRSLYIDVKHILEANGTEEIRGWGWENKNGVA